MFSGILTGIFLLLFLLGSVWLWRPALSASMRAAAAIPLQDDDGPEPTSVNRGEGP